MVSHNYCSFHLFFYFLSYGTTTNDHILSFHMALAFNCQSDIKLTFCLTKHPGEKVCVKEAFWNKTELYPGFQSVYGMNGKLNHVDSLSTEPKYSNPDEGEWVIQMKGQWVRV